MRNQQSAALLNKIVAECAQSIIALGTTRRKEKYIANIFAYAQKIFYIIIHFVGNFFILGTDEIIYFTMVNRFS